MPDAPASDSEAALLPPDAVPLGFRFAAVRAGIKPSGRPDLACIVAVEGTQAAAMFTSNRVVAAPVTIGREHLRSTAGDLRAVVVNSGNANCATGAAGLAAARQTCEATAALLGCAAEQVVPCSTGIIGVPLPVEKLTAALPHAAAALAEGADGFSAFARAILTTDTRPKVAYRTVLVEGQLVRIAGACKGAGMIYPRLAAALAPHATMLVYLLTDARLDAPELRALLAASVEQSFHRISIDGDTSTNDTVLLLASGQSGVAVPPAHAGFRRALGELCQQLALSIVEDGEGAAHVVTLEITGAATDADALSVARAIAHSPLVKTAWAGADPNWGRLVSTIGASGIGASGIGTSGIGGSGVPIDPERIAITLNGLPVCEHGARARRFDEAAVHAAMTQRGFTIAVELGLGAGACRFWTTDLTTEYVHINADYSS